MASILNHGILNRRRSQRLLPVTIDDPDVQRRRDAKRVPGVGRRLHDYAALYAHARNATPYRRLDQAPALVVLRVSPDVLDIPGTTVTDRNAAAGIARFFPPAAGIAALDADEVFAVWWNDSHDARQKRCAEVLVPDRVPPELILGARVVDRHAEVTLRAALSGVDLEVAVSPDLFFRGDPS